MRVLEGNLVAVSQVGWEAETLTHMARATNTGNPQIFADIDVLIKALKTAGVWTHLDQLCVMHDNLADSLLNLRGTAIEVDWYVSAGTPGFNTTDGILCQTGNHVASGVNANNYTRHTHQLAHVMVYVTSDWQDNTTPLLTSDSPGETYMRANDSGGDPVNSWKSMTCGSYLTASHELVIQSSVGGCLIGNCRFDRDHSFRMNDTVVSNGNLSGASHHTTEYYIYGGISPVELGVGAMSVGGDLTNTQMANYENAIRAYAQARGFDAY